MPHTGDPGQAGMHMVTRPLPNESFATSPVTGYANGIIVTNPKKDGSILVIKNIDISAYQVAIDGTDAVTLALKVTDAAGGAISTPVAAYNLKSTNTSLVAKGSDNVYSGTIQLAQGYSLLFEITVTSPDTAGFGYELSLETQFEYQ